MRLGPLLSDARAFASQHARWIPGIGLLARSERKRRLRTLQHEPGGHPSLPPGVIVADKIPTADDVVIAGRLLRAFRAATQSGGATLDPERRDLWTIIAAHQRGFASLLRAGDDEAA